MDSDSERRARAQARRNWPIRRQWLTEFVDENLSTTTTAAERIAMVWRLTLDAWASAGWSIPDYHRENAPIRVLRGRHEDER